MSTTSPLRPHQEQQEARFIPFGEKAEVPGEFESHEIEYAALRKGVGLLDAPHRALLKCTGSERQSFLHRMVSRECEGLDAGDVRRALLLDAKGRIMADMLVAETGQATLLDTDVHQAGQLYEELDKLLFTEDVTIEDLSETHHRVSLHGPKAHQVRDWWRDQLHQAGADEDAWDYEYSQTGEPGVHLWARSDLIDRFAAKQAQLEETFDLKPIGWLAFNIARIEYGYALFNIDFGPGSLPHEAGQAVVDEAVSFTKGCYRGQEIVARMESRGHPPKTLTGFRAEGEAMPVDGAPVLEGTDANADPVGAVTSSTFSPMLGRAVIGFAMIKWGHHEPNTKLHTPADGTKVPITTHPMRFYDPNTH